MDVDKLILIIKSHKYIILIFHDVKKKMKYKFIGFGCLKNI